MTSPQLTSHRLPSPLGIPYKLTSSKTAIYLLCLLEGWGARVGWGGWWGCYAQIQSGEDVGLKFKISMRYHTNSL